MNENYTHKKINGEEVKCGVDEDGNLICGTARLCHLCPYEFWGSLDWGDVRRKWFDKYHDYSHIVEEWAADILNELSRTCDIDVMKCTDKELAEFFEELTWTVSIFDDVDDSHLSSVARNMFTLAQCGDPEPYKHYEEMREEIRNFKQRASTSNISKRTQKPKI